METEFQNQNPSLMMDQYRDSDSCYDSLSRRFTKSPNPDGFFQTKKRLSQVKPLTKSYAAFLNSRLEVECRKC